MSKYVKQPGTIITITIIFLPGIVIYLDMYQTRIWLSFCPVFRFDKHWILFPHLTTTLCPPYIINPAARSEQFKGISSNSLSQRWVYFRYFGREKTTTMTCMKPSIIIFIYQKDVKVVADFSVQAFFAWIVIVLQLQQKKSINVQTNMNVIVTSEQIQKTDHIFQWSKNGWVENLCVCILLLHCYFRLTCHDCFLHLDL